MAKNSAGTRDRRILIAACHFPAFASCMFVAKAELVANRGFPLIVGRVSGIKGNHGHRMFPFSRNRFHAYGGCVVPGARLRVLPSAPAPAAFPASRPTAGSKTLGQGWRGTRTEKRLALREWLRLAHSPQTSKGGTIASIEIVCASGALAQAFHASPRQWKRDYSASGSSLPTRLSPLSLAATRAAWSCPRHLSSDQGAMSMTTRSRSARWRGAVLRHHRQPRLQGAHCRLPPPCPLSSPSMFDLPFPDGKTM